MSLGRPIEGPEGAQWKSLEDACPRVPALFHPQRDSAALVQPSCRPPRRGTRIPVSGVSGKSGDVSAGFAETHSIFRSVEKILESRGELIEFDGNSLIDIFRGFDIVFFRNLNKKRYAC